MITSSEHNKVRPIYMDHHATTPVDPRVLAAMLPYFTEQFGNASSTDHLYGAEAAQAVEQARAQVAALIGAQPAEIVFTSGATEADNLALVGIARQLADRGDHIVTCVTEHPAVLVTCRHLQSEGCDITFLPVDRFGVVDPEAVRRAITHRTVLVSIMTANNEIGAIAPIEEIGRVTRERGVLFHTDAAQAAGHIALDVQKANVDLLSLSAHKFYGPKGIGGLFVRKNDPRVRVAAQLHGGGHERGIRSGTLNVPAIVGLGVACDLARSEMPIESQRLRGMRDQLWEQLQANVECIELNGHPTDRLSHNLNVAIPGVESRSLVMQLKNEFAFSTGSACATASVEPSHVILALEGWPESEHSGEAGAFANGLA
jgi:cysteine desulfurase